MKKMIVILILLFIFYQIARNMDLNIDTFSESKTITENTLDIYYTSTQPISVDYEILETESFISTQKMLLLNKESIFENETISEKIKNTDFEKDTLLLITYNNKIDNFSYGTIDRTIVELNIDTSNKQIYSTILITIHNLKIKNLKYISIN